MFVVSIGAREKQSPWAVGLLAALPHRRSQPAIPPCAQWPTFPSRNSGNSLCAWSGSWYKARVDITRILEAMRGGDPQAPAELLAEVYQELRRLAAHKMAGESPGQTLQATALVHEAWLRLGGGNDQHFANRAHFFAAAGEAMRRILVENARRKKRLKRGGDRQKVDLEDIDLPAPMPDEDLLSLDEALNRLAEVDGRSADLVKLCFFVGLTQEQAAKELGISISTVERTWAYARAWLLREMERSRLAPK
jgi:RNA polymerase sigma factor (TIGR02999 family)